METAAPQSPDFAEATPAPAAAEAPPLAAAGISLEAAGPIAPAAGQPEGALSGRIVFTSAGHGWTWGSSGWFTQRGVNNEICEDFGNQDQMTMFAYYCFNAGATVQTRGLGIRTRESFFLLTRGDDMLTTIRTESFSSETCPAFTVEILTSGGSNRALRFPNGTIKWYM